MKTINRTGSFCCFIHQLGAVQHKCEDPASWMVAFGLRPDEVTEACHRHKDSMADVPVWVAPIDEGDLPTMEAIYRAETNVLIKSDWDDGYTWGLGGGFADVWQTSGVADTFDGAVLWLRRAFGALQVTAEKAAT